VASAVASTSRQVGNTLGVAIIGATLASALATVIGPGLAAASHTGWWVVTSFGVAVAATGVVTTTQWAQTTAHRTAGLISPNESR
jgi:hypothetical protein